MYTFAHTHAHLDDKHTFFESVEYLSLLSYICCSFTQAIFLSFLDFCNKCVTNFETCVPSAYVCEFCKWHRLTSHHNNFFIAQCHYNKPIFGAADFNRYRLCVHIAKY